MLGGALFNSLPKASQEFQVYGTFRSGANVPLGDHNSKLIGLEDVFDENKLRDILVEYEIDIVINAIGLIKQIVGTSKLSFIKVNAMLPHYLMELCDEVGARFIEISTDCVFSGKKGNYTENDIADAKDIYGVTKLLGEVTDNPNAITIRTSIIGHESGRAASLIDWFLSTSGEVKGFSKAIFSGFPTAYLASIIGQYVIPNRELNGLYHVSAEPIDKFTLLMLVANVYEHNVQLTPDTKLVIDRSLNSNKFRKATGFTPPAWPELIKIMQHERPVWKFNEN